MTTSLPKYTSPDTVRCSRSLMSGMWAMRTWKSCRLANSGPSLMMGVVTACLTGDGINLQARHVTSHTASVHVISHAPDITHTASSHMAHHVA
jgi:hypothetical protein